MFLNFSHSRRGQGLFEVIIGIGVIMAGTVGTITLISSTVMAGRTVSEKVVAASLAREGIEVVRNLRDSNWLKIQANVDTDNDATNGIQLPKSFEGVFNEAPPWHVAVPKFDRAANSWSVAALDPTVNPVTFATSCGSAPCSQVFFDNNGYYQDTSGSGSQSRFRRLVTLNPICRADFDQDGLPDVESYYPNQAEEAIKTDDNQNCSGLPDNTNKHWLLVGLQVISRVTWDGEINCPSAKCFELEDRLYNWKYVK